MEGGKTQGSFPLTSFSHTKPFVGHTISQSIIVTTIPAVVTQEGNKIGFGSGLKVESKWIKSE